VNHRNVYYNLAMLVHDLNQGHICLAKKHGGCSITIISICSYNIH